MSLLSRSLGDQVRLGDSEHAWLKAETFCKEGLYLDL